MQGLCEALADLGVWVRLHYVYPYPHVDKIIPLMAEKKILPYLDIPFQHASLNILKAMRRPATTEKSLQRIEGWRVTAPDLTIRSTFIVGFPGETDQDFEVLLEFLQEARLDRVGCFQYSAVNGAKANDLPNQVPEQLKEERWQRFMETQQQISSEQLAKKIGSTINVIIDKEVADGYIGRSTADAPEIDGLVYFDSPRSLNIGEILEVTISSSDEYDLYGQAKLE
jgi:ribosomal protein S12 methylthiotransferase